jgi:7,8-dihydropterin-6-yl-methyl-4-(beta-D-ribofuranosyl)aminobenzene 5'-phosphate synthase
MKLTCLIDNCASSHFWGEHGLSFLIETGGQRTLFDAGLSGTVLLHNLAVAETAPSSITALALSHGHYDHTGGLDSLMPQCPGLPIYAHPGILRERWARQGEKLRAIGLPMNPDRLREQGHLQLSQEPQEIAPGVWTTGQIVARPEAEGRAEGHVVRQGDGLVPDPYEDDMALVLRGKEGLVLLCGCCHAGLLNTLYHVQATFGALPRTVIGGSHLVTADAQGVRHVAERLQQLDGLALYPNHCTGQAAYVALAVALGNRVSPCPAGSVLTV